MKVFSKVMLKQFNLALDKNVMEAGSQLNQDANEVNEVLKNMQEEYKSFSSAATNNARDVNYLCGKQSSLMPKCRVWVNNLPPWVMLGGAFRQSSQVQRLCFS